MRQLILTRFVPWATREIKPVEIEALALGKPNVKLRSMRQEIKGDSLLNTFDVAEEM